MCGRFAVFADHRRRTSDAMERLNKELKRHTPVATLFPRSLGRRTFDAPVDRWASSTHDAG